MKISKLTILIMTLTVLGKNAYSQSDREQGIELFRNGEYEKALPILQARVVEEKRDRPAWIYLGAVLVKLGKLDEARAAFRNRNTVYKENVPTVYDKKLKITNRPQAIYPSNARSKGTSGVVSIAVEMRGDGKIGFVVPFVELPDGLTESSVKAANSLKFEPAWKDGKPVTTVNIIDYSFNTY